MKLPILKYIPLLLLLACNESASEGDLSTIPYRPTPFTISMELPFPKMEFPFDNPMTEEGIALGRRLFYDPILSKDSTISCSSCHELKSSFTDRLATSKGVDNASGRRSSMSLVNVGYYHNGLFWDGRSSSLEAQALIPVEDPLEMKESWANVIRKIKRQTAYPNLFRAAFGVSNKNEITKELVVKAIAQFERSLVSTASSKYDQVKSGQAQFTKNEAIGEDLFFDITMAVKDAECGNCHNDPLFTTNEFANNGLDEVKDINSFKDLGRGAITEDKYDNGKFRIPSLRNIAHTAPYMHDGRFATLEEVLEHYDKGGHPSPTVHPIIRPLGLTDLEKKQIILFLHTLTDTLFFEQQAYDNPFSIKQK